MATNCPHCSKSVDGWIPEDRLQKATAERRDAQTAAEQLKTQLEEAQASAAGAVDLQSQLEAAQAAQAALTKNHDRTLAVMGAGVNDREDVADLLAVFDRRAPEGVTVADWIANRDQLPRSARALLPGSAPAIAAAATEPAATQAAAEPAPVQNGTPAPAAAMPPAKNGAVTTPPSAQGYSASSIGQMTVAEYRQNRENVLASLTQAKA